MTGSRKALISGGFVIGVIGLWNFHETKKYGAVIAPLASHTDTQNQDSINLFSKSKTVGPLREQKENMKELQAFIQEGWEPTYTEPPQNEQLLSEPNPNDQETKMALHTLLRTAAFSEQDLESLSDIARHSSDPQTISYALEAISQLRSNSVENTLSNLYRELPDPSTRLEILSLLEPNSIDSSGARLLLQILQEPGTNQKSKHRALMSLAGIVFSDPSHEQWLVDSMPKEWRNEFLDAIRKIKGSQI